MVSGSISLRYSRFFSPFLHSTGSLSVFYSYLALRDGPRSFRQDSSCPALLRIPLTHMNVTCTGLSPSVIELSRSFQLIHTRTAWSYNPDIAVTTSVWAISFSLATTQEIDISFFSCRYLDVSVPCVGSSFDVSCLQHDGFPHSETSGSIRVCQSPEFFAAFRVLLRR